MSPTTGGAPAPHAALEVDRVTHRYEDRTALDTVTFAVGSGELFALLGPNGGGKTTLFRIIATLLRPTSGSVRLHGCDVLTDAAAVRRRLGIVFQTPALDSQLTVAENLRHHGHLYGMAGAALERSVARSLEALSLVERSRDRVGTLSGGLQRRVELAKALLHEARVLVLDEPSTGLDPRARREFWDALVDLRTRTGATIVLTTHLMEEAARCARVAILHHGRLVAIGAPDELTATVGGDVLWFSARDAEALAHQVRARFGVAAELVDGRVRVERPRGHEFVTAVIEAFPGEIETATVSRPTLEDVFVHHTGERFS